jgi:hypothetical protein
MSAQKVRPRNFPVVSFPVDEESKVWNLDDGTSIHIPGSALTALLQNPSSKTAPGSGSGPNSNPGAADKSAVKLVFFLISNLDRALAPSATAGAFLRSRTRTKNAVVGSRVVSASVGPGRHIQLAYPVSIVFRNIRVENATRRFCVFWDYTTR